MNFANYDFFLQELRDIMEDKRLEKDRLIESNLEEIDKIFKEKNISLDFKGFMLPSRCHEHNPLINDRASAYFRYTDSSNLHIIFQFEIMTIPLEQKVNFRPVKNFIDSANRGDIYMVCNICMEDVVKLNYCLHCGNEVCVECADKIHRCPYCRRYATF